MKGVKGEKSKAKVTVSVFGWMSFALTVLAIIAIFFSLFGSSNNGKEIFGFKINVAIFQFFVSPLRKYTLFTRNSTQIYG